MSSCHFYLHPDTRNIGRQEPWDLRNEGPNGLVFIENRMKGNPLGWSG